MPPINRIAYPGDGSLHTFYVSADGHLRHKWDNSGGGTRDEDLSRLLHLGPVQQERPQLAITPDGDLLVGIYGTDGIFNDIRWNKQAVRWEQWVGH